ncbi:MAG TPA: hypothetical protein DHU96_28435, partial [Actinobacteria bacterium]|nr:hypothetical protein [Actinomycetota bacterium]
GLIARLENRLAGLEAARTRALADTGHARSEIAAGEVPAERLVLVDAAHNQAVPCGVQDTPRQRERVF